ncbi:MAG: acylneuraminate cytidylyltransferase family protein [Desulfuromonadales bacterium]|nr:acylneuraminate cytidylyltransferase family protein [Desulfuromonadales bacterium]
MRHSSERVPGKNYRMFAGKPLFHHVVGSFMACPEIDEVVIDTDSQMIMDDAASHFPTARVLKRPEHLRDAAIPMNAVLLHTTKQIVADFYLQSHSTNPLLSSTTTSCAIQCFLKNLDKFDSLFSVKRLQTRLWDASGRPLNHNPDKLIRTQDLPPVFEENSCIYIFSRQTLEKRGNRIGENPLLFEMDSIESLDIDEEVDFQIAELLFLNRANLKVNEK